MRMMSACYRCSIHSQPLYSACNVWKVHRTENNGFSCEQLLLQRGVRQGWPLYSLLFVIGIEILDRAISRWSSIKGTEIDCKTCTVCGCYQRYCLERLNPFTNSLTCLLFFAPGWKQTSQNLNCCGYNHNVSPPFSTTVNLGVSFQELPLPYV